jgi:cysteine/O-acetylserine efflux protein
VDINLVPFMSFVLITTFTPGPNNISSTSMGVLYGYRKSLPYLLGIASGFFLVMLLCGFVSTTLLKILPSFEQVLRILGALYIVWLAVGTLRTSYTITTDDQLRRGYLRGALLQLMNMKMIIYGMTIYATFLSTLVQIPVYLLVSAFLLASLAFVSISVWAIFGSVIRTYLQNPKIKAIVNVTLALLLVYSAVELSGLLPI